MQRTIESHGLTFGKLTRGERGEITKALARARREQYAATLKEAGVTGEAFVNEIDALDEELRAGGRGLFIGYANSDEGQADIQLRCLRKQKPDAGPDDLPHLDDTASLQLTCELTGLVFKLEEPAAGDEKPEEPARPSEGDVYQQT